MELVAELVLRSLETAEDFDGWHYLLEHDSYRSYVTGVIHLVRHEALSCGSNVYLRAREQLTSPAQKAVERLAASRDSKQRIAMNVAAPQNRKQLEDASLYLKRYRIGTTAVHDSETALILIADDVERQRRVAVKLMKFEDQWQREMTMREAQGAGHLNIHVLEIFDNHVDEKAKRCVNPKPFVITMPAAEKDLSDLLSHNRIAGLDIQAVVDIMRQVGQHVQYLHKFGRIHGDLKPRNIVKIEKQWCAHILSLVSMATLGL